MWLKVKGLRPICTIPNVLCLHKVGRGEIPCMLTKQTIVATMALGKHKHKGNTNISKM
jgi:hypothetical protein